MYYNRGLTRVVGFVYAAYLGCFIYGATSADRWGYLRWPMRVHWLLLVVGWVGWLATTVRLCDLKKDDTRAAEKGEGTQHDHFFTRVFGDETPYGPPRAYPLAAAWYALVDGLMVTYLPHDGPATMPWPHERANRAWAATIGILACCMCFYKSWWRLRSPRERSVGDAPAAVGSRLALPARLG